MPTIPETTTQPPPATGSQPPDPLALARMAVQEEEMTTSQLEYLDHRIMAIEHALAAPWPVRLVRVAVLGRQIRRSVAAFAWAGPTWQARRTEATTNAWLCR